MDRFPMLADAIRFDAAQRPPAAPRPRHGQAERRPRAGPSRSGPGTTACRAGPSHRDTMPEQLGEELARPSRVTIDLQDAVGRAGDRPSAVPGARDPPLAIHGHRPVKLAFGNLLVAQAARRLHFHAVHACAAVEAYFLRSHAFHCLRNLGGVRPAAGRCAPPWYWLNRAFSLLISTTATHGSSV